MRARSRRGNGSAIVRKGDRTGLGHGAELGERLAGPPDADGADHPYPARGIPRPLDNPADPRPLVERRLGVWHRAHGGEPAAGRRLRARGDRLRRLVAGLTEMGVQVAETGAGDQAAGIDPLRTGGQERRIPDESIHDRQVPHRVGPVIRVDEPHARQE